MTAATNLQRNYLPEEQPVRRPAARPARRTAPAVNPVPAILLCQLLVFSMALGYVYQKTQLMQLTHALADLQTELSSLQREQGYLLLAAEKARSPQQWEKLARERLGMVVPTKVEYLTLAEAPAAPAGSTGVEGRKTGFIRNLAAWVERHWPHGAVEAARRP